MPLASDPAQNPIYFPLAQGERASHLHVDQLLPRDIYEKLAEMLQESLEQLPGNEDGELPEYISEPEQFARLRSHTAIFLDGDRGTGKTTVIVNLQDYLRAAEVRDRFGGMADDIHILQPIDSSQLEDDDDLFLNVVVAAVLGDVEIQRGREKNPQRWQELYDGLQHLGKALAGKETQSDGVGLDRLRSFMGARELASDVHNFFFKAAKLLGKRLLVLPIDDVDTTLHRAFENLEVVRRYLASPVLLPIVCGDLRLYRDVIWRDAMRRLTKGLNKFEEEAKPTADTLAVEYLRKILPLHRRLRMPEVKKFLRNNNILLGTSLDKVAPRLSLPDLDAWLRALLAGPVNGHENSNLRIPIPTIRALSQLVARVRTEIPALERARYNETAGLPATDLMRRIAYLRQGETTQPLRAGISHPVPATATNTLSLARWQSALFDHFMFEPDGGPVCLVVMAALHWDKAPHASVLDTPLFAPHTQLALHELRYNEARVKLDWQDDLRDRVPDSWLKALPPRSILSFATPEAGRAVVIESMEIRTKDLDDSFPQGMPQLLIDLMIHRSFYSPSKRATLICCGRLLELVVTSLVRDVSAAEITRILAAAPFHSAAAVAATKATRITLDDIEFGDLDDDPDSELDAEEPLEEDGESSLFANDMDRVERHVAINQLSQDINEWRREIGACNLALSPWFIYCALNKAFHQAPLHTRPRHAGEQPKREKLSDVIASGLSTFNSFWAAVASFEKGPIFDLSLETSNVNLVNRRGDFHYNDLYTQNIKPLLRHEHGTIHGEKVVATTWALSQHPLRDMFQQFFEYLRERDSDYLVDDEVDGRTYFRETLKIPSSVKRFTVASIIKSLKLNAPRGVNPARHGRSVLVELARRYPALPELSTLVRAIEECERDSEGPH